MDGKAKTEGTESVKNIQNRHIHASHIITLECCCIKNHLI